MYVRHEQEVVDRVLELAAAGVPKLRIASDVGLSPTTVRRWIRSGGVRVGRPAPCTLDVCPTRDAVDPFAYAYVLGLYLGDGHIVRSPRTYRLEISCDPKYPGIIAESDDIRGLFAEACDAIGVHARRMNQWNLSVADAEGVRRLDRFVGPKY